MRREGWGGRWDSNPRRPESQSGALPTELRPPFFLARPAGLLRTSLCSARSGRPAGVQNCSRQFCRTCSIAGFSPAALDLARPAGLEPATLGLEGRCSIQLSYGRIAQSSLWLACSQASLIHFMPSGRGRGIRTPDPLLPKQMRYQTAPCPARSTTCRHRGADHTDRPTRGQFNRPLICVARSCPSARPRVTRRPPRADHESGRTPSSYGRCARPGVQRSIPRSAHRSVSRR